MFVKYRQINAEINEQKQFYEAQNIRFYEWIWVRWLNFAKYLKVCFKNKEKENQQHKPEKNSKTETFEIVEAKYYLSK